MHQAFAVPPVDVRQRIPERTIRALAQAIAEKFHPQRIILFGSYAYGQPEPESDLDLLVVMDTSLRESEQALDIRRQLNLLFGLDLLATLPKSWPSAWPGATRSCRKSSAAASYCMNPLTLEWVAKPEGGFNMSS